MPGELTNGLAAALGALQGVTEFLPVSSSGHLSLAEAWLGLDAARVGHRFNVVVHAGTRRTSSISSAASSAARPTPPASPPRW